MVLLGVVLVAFKLVVKVVAKPLLRLLGRKPPKPLPGPTKPPPEATKLYKKNTGKHKKT